MNEMFLQAGSAGALLLLLHLRLNRMEVRLDAIADNLQIPRPNKRKRFSPAIIALAFVVLAAGCAYTKTCSAPGVCTTHFQIDTNAIPFIRAMGEAVDQAR